VLPPACGGVAPPLHLPHPRWSWPLTSCCPSTVCHRVPSRACAPRVAKSCCVTRFRTLQGRRQARERMLACPRAALSSPQRRQVGGVSTTLCAHASRRGTHTHAHAYALVRKRARARARSGRDVGKRRCRPLSAECQSAAWTASKDASGSCGQGPAGSCCVRAPRRTAGRASSAGCQTPASAIARAPRARAAAY
jgi:hypothetical protein